MREVNLSGLDLNLLPSLESLLRRCNVTRAAADVGLSQPAMSRALGRLREIFDDPLLVRGRGRLALTPFAVTLAPKLAGAMADLKGLFHTPTFDPATLRRRFRLAGGDVHSILLGPRLAARLRDEAPHVDLRFEPIGRDILDRMDQGEIDLCFATATTPLPPGATSETIGRDRLSLVMRRGHPGAETEWTLSDYARYPHATVAFFRDGVSDVDALLARGGVERRIALTTPHFMATIAAVATTDLVTTISAVFARRFAEPLGLVLKTPPFDDRLDVALVGTRLAGTDPAILWFRKMIREEAAAIYEPAIL